MTDRTATLQSLLAERILVLDGAMGTMIQRERLTEEQFRGERFRSWGRDLRGNNDLLTLTQPALIRRIHLDYLAAGVDIIETNTFNSTAVSLGDYGMEDLAYELNLAAARLNELPLLGRDFLKAQVYIEQALQPRLPDVQVVDLQEAWAGILGRAKLVQHHKITREALSVREHMSIVLRKLQGRKFVEFEKLFDPSKGQPVVVVTFIALLELAKEILVEITQAEAFAPIYVRLAFTPSA